MKRNYKNLLFIVILGLTITTKVYAGTFSSDYVIKVCGFDYIPDRLPAFTSGLVNLVKLLVPVILIIMGMIDMTSAMMASDDNKMKKAQNKFVNRILAAIIVFFVVAIVQMVFNVIDINSYKSNYSKCMNCLINNSGCSTTKKSIVNKSCKAYSADACPDKDTYGTPCTIVNSSCDYSCGVINNMSTCSSKSLCKWVGSSSDGKCYYSDDLKSNINYSVSSDTRPDTSSASFTSIADAMVRTALTQKGTGGATFQNACGLSSNDAWCAAFVSWAMKSGIYNGQKASDVAGLINGTKAYDSLLKEETIHDFVNANNCINGAGMFMRHFRYSTLPNVKFKYNDFCDKYIGKNGSGNYVPKMGDIIIFDWNEYWDGSWPINDNGHDHVGIVKEVSNGIIYTIEGNTYTIEGNSDDKEQQKVQEKSYNISSCKVVGYGVWY